MGLRTQVRDWVERHRSLVAANVAVGDDDHLLGELHGSAKHVDSELADSLLSLLPSADRGRIAPGRVR